MPSSRPTFHADKRLLILTYALCEQWRAEIESATGATLQARIHTIDPEGRPVFKLESSRGRDLDPGTALKVILRGSGEVVTFYSRVVSTDGHGLTVEIPACITGGGRRVRGEALKSPDTEVVFHVKGRAGVLRLLSRRSRRRACRSHAPMACSASERATSSRASFGLPTAPVAA